MKPFLLGSKLIVHALCNGVRVDILDLAGELATWHDDCYSPVSPHNFFDLSDTLPSDDVNK